MIDEKEIIRRRDMRDAFTFTIDPADAKDFDDAISFEMLTADEDEQSCNSAIYQIGVHIADVSFYVRPNTTIDDEAYQRGNSVYLVDRVIPMLPEELCNDKCSLKPGEDKLCMSVIFTMDAEANVLKHKICRTVIRSDVRLNYDEAQSMLSSASTVGRPSVDCRSTVGTQSLREALFVLNEIALKLFSQLQHLATLSFASRLFEPQLGHMVLYFDF